MKQAQIDEYVSDHYESHVCARFWSRVAEAIGKLLSVDAAIQFQCVCGNRTFTVGKGAVLYISYSLTLTCTNPLCKAQIRVGPTDWYVAVTDLIMSRTRAKPADP